MDEWPDQPRLTDALHRIADKVDVDTDHRRRVRNLLLAGEARDRKAVNSRRPWGKPMSWSVLGPGIVLAGIIFGIMVGLRPWSMPTSTIQADQSGEPTAPTSTTISEGRGPTGTPAAELTRDNLCRTHLGKDLIEARITTDVAGVSEATPVGIQLAYEEAMILGSVGFVSFGAESDWREGEYLDVLGIRAEVGAQIRLPRIDEPERARAVIERLMDELCSTATYLIVPHEAAPYGHRFLCRLSAGPQLPSGVVLIDPDLPPPQCEGTVPAVIVGSDLTDDLDQWAGAFGCSGLNRAEGAAENTELLRFEQCGRTLVLIDIDSPLDRIWTDADLAALVVEQAIELR